MDNIIEKLLEKWTESHGKEAKYGPDEVKNIIVNCISLSETWFDRHEEKVKVSYELALFNKESVLFETLHGVTRETLPEALLKVITDMDDKVSKVNLNSFHFNDGKKVVKTIGELEIS